MLAVLAVASKIGLLRINAQFMRLPEKRKAALTRISSRILTRILTGDARAFLYGRIDRHRMRKRIAGNSLQRLN